MSEANPIATHPGDARRNQLQATIVGGGIAGLASAAYLIRDGGVPGPNIRVLEAASRPGGSLDATGSAEQGYSMHGSRMFGVAYVHMYEPLDNIPSLDDPEKSITQDLFEFWKAAPWYGKARLIDRGRILDPRKWGLSHRDQADFVRLMLCAQDTLDGVRIDECFGPDFFATHFWHMWSSMFGFETWHSADELRRYVLRFLRLFPDLETMQAIQSTRYSGYHSIVRPMVRWLEAQGVRWDTGVEVTDLDFEGRQGVKAVRRIRCLRDGQPDDIDVDTGDLVIVTLGSKTADASKGSMSAAPVLRTDPDKGAWGLWRRLAAKDGAFGRPEVFCGHVDQTKWITFTVTDTDGRFFDRMEQLSGSPAGGGGLTTLISSSWMLTFHLYHSPACAGQPEGIGVWWGYGLFPDRAGDFVAKTMAECTGREILVELFSHLGMQEDLPTLLECSICIPCMLPYTTSQFMPRGKGDRPPVIPPGTANLAFVGQYCEIPDNVVYTVEYSIHAARLAVAGLLDLDVEIPPTYKGLEHPNAMVAVLKRILQ